MNDDVIIFVSPGLLIANRGIVSFSRYLLF